jgi:pimeloyl-ACP methyl ester carboxylesterase
MDLPPGSKNPPEMQPIVLRGAAGRALHADQLLPRATGGQKTATSFVWIHGLASVRASQKSDALMALAQRSGAGCLRLDMTGHGQSEGGLDDVTLSSWVQDVDCAVQHAALPAAVPTASGGSTRVRYWLVSMLFIRHVVPRSLTSYDPPAQLLSGAQVVLVGYSMGGLAAVHLAAQKPAHLAALVLLAPGFGLAERLHEAPVDAATGTLQMLSAYVASGSLGVSPKLLRDLQENYCSDDESVARALRLPTFIAHGEEDDAVPIARAAAFHAALLGGSSAQRQLLRIDGEAGGDHRLNRCIGWIFAEVESFLQRQGLLPPSAAG